MLAVEAWLLNEAGVGRVSETSNFYLQRNAERAIALITRTTINDLPLTGEEEYCRNFSSYFKMRFEVDSTDSFYRSCIMTGRKHTFGGCELAIDKEVITASKNKYWKRVHKTEMIRERQKISKVKASARKILKFGKRTVSLYIWKTEFFHRWHW